MKVYYSDHFVLPLPPEHRFPMRKYALLRELVVAHGIVAPENLLVPDPATDEQILRAHDAGYLERVKRGDLTRQEIRRIWFNCLRRRSQKNRRSGWDWFETVTACFPLPPPRITHPWTPRAAPCG